MADSLDVIFEMADAWRRQPSFDVPPELAVIVLAEQFGVSCAALNNALHGSGSHDEWRSALVTLGGMIAQAVTEYDTIEDEGRRIESPRKGNT